MNVLYAFRMGQSVVQPLSSGQRAGISVPVHEWAELDWANLYAGIAS
jgi:hypothetical protein